MGRLGVLVSMAVWLPTLQVYQMENVEESWRGLAYGALSMAMGLGFATISYTGGVVIEHAWIQQHFYHWRNIKRDCRHPDVRHQPA